MTQLKLCMLPSFDRGFEDFGEGDLYVTGTTLVEYFKGSLKNTPFDSVDFTYEPKAAAITDQDLVCYMLANANRSIVARKVPGSQLGPSGSTIQLNDGTVISEIYIDVTAGDARRSTLVANLIYHEWMHNHLDASTPVLQLVHNIAGGVLSTGNTIKSSMSPSNADKAAVTRGLNRKVKQYTGNLP